MAIYDRYREGARRLVPMPVANTSAISVGDILIIDGVAGYVTRAAAGANNPIGVAYESCAAPTADGDVTILVDTSPESIYEYPPDTGSCTVALNGLTCDIGGVQSINIDASADDVVVIQRADAVANTVFVSFNFTPAGVA